MGSGGEGHRQSWKHEVACSIIYLPWVSGFCLVFVLYFTCMCGHVMNQIGELVCENTLKEIFCLGLSCKQVCWYNLVGISEMEISGGCLSSIWRVHKYAVDRLKLDKLKGSQKTNKKLSNSVDSLVSYKAENVLWFSFITVIILNVSVLFLPECTGLRDNATSGSFTKAIYVQRAFPTQKFSTLLGRGVHYGLSISFS